MATLAQLTANRANAQLSTGPRSAEGKAISRFNALKHGAGAQSPLLPFEDPDALDHLTRAYLDLYQPAGPEEEFLVERIIRADWTLRRLEFLEVQAFHALLAAEDSLDAVGAVLLKDAASGDVLDKLARRQRAAHREWYRARVELQRIRRDQPLPPPPPPAVIAKPIVKGPHSIPTPPPAPIAQLSTAPRNRVRFDISDPPEWRL